MKDVKICACLAVCLSNPGCSNANAYEVATDEKCVIDRCEKKTCTVETPEGWVDVYKQPDYAEGKKITCPLWLIEPT